MSAHPLAMRVLRIAANAGLLKAAPRQPETRKPAAPHAISVLLSF
jgi:hypothetical protein